ncbi:hypothetical protein M3Y96_00403900 [Aphelenchoides besseyi]|nr:hypothetical protein M3Y96_00403900 [Aphelenchoides besseyi]
MHKTFSLRPKSMAALSFVLLCILLAFEFFIDLKVIADDYQACFKEVGNDVELRGLSNSAAAELEVPQYGDVEMEIDFDFSWERGYDLDMIIGNLEVVFEMRKYRNKPKHLAIWNHITQQNMRFLLPCLGKIAEYGVFLQNASSSLEELVAFGPVDFIRKNGARRILIQSRTYDHSDFPVIRFKKTKIFKPQPMTTSAPPAKKSTNPLLIKDKPKRVKDESKLSNKEKSSKKHKSAKYVKKSPKKSVKKVTAEMKPKTEESGHDD